MEKYINLFHGTELVAFKPQEREAYQASLKYYRDLKNVIDTAFDDGLNMGIEQGRGQERLNIAKNLKSLGFSDQQIAAASGLSLAEIAGL